MKVAILFHGHLRSFRDNDTIVPMLLDQYPDADVFAQTFCVRNFRGNKWHTDDGGADEPVTMDDVRLLFDRFRLKGLNESYFKSGGEALPPAYAAMGFRWAKEKACTMLHDYEKKHGTKYDVVFLARYDLGFNEPFRFPDVIEPNTLYGGYNRNQEQRGYDGEVFLYGSPEVIDKCVIPAVPKGLESLVVSSGFHGEQVMTAARKLAGVEYKAHRIPHFLYRSDGGRLAVWQ